MSGGSYDYLCFAEVCELFKQTQIEKMRDRLASLGFMDAAKETEELRLTLNSFYVRTSAVTERLKNVWRAVEWMDSGDSGLEEVEEAIEEYRKK